MNKATTFLKPATGAFATLSLLVMPVLASANMDEGVSSAVEADAYIGASLNHGSSSNASTSDEGLIDVKVNDEVSSDTHAEAESEDKASSSDDLKNDTAFELNVDGVAVVNSSDVQSEDDLEVFAHNVAAKENAVSEVEFDSDDAGASSVTVYYDHAARLFGFLPIGMTYEAMVTTDADGNVNVDVSEPWYGFLVVSDSKVAADLKTKIENNSTVKANAAANASAESRARIAEAMVAEINAELTAMAEVNG